jgi:hypothetical protein
MDISSILLNQLLLTIVPWIAGGLLGGGLGYLLALAIRPLGARPGLHRALRVLPWRSITFALVAIAINSVYPFILLGPALRTVMPGIGFFGYSIACFSFSILILALPFTTSITAGYWFPPTLGERLVAGARTLGVASAVIALTASYWGVSSPGHLIAAAMDAFDYPRVWLGYSIIVSTALIVDLVMGLIQMAIARPSKAEVERKGSAHSSLFWGCSGWCGDYDFGHQRNNQKEK